MQALFEMKVTADSRRQVDPTRMLLALRLRHHFGAYPGGYGPVWQCGLTAKKKPGGEAGPKAG